KSHPKPAGPFNIEMMHKRWGPDPRFVETLIRKFQKQIERDLPRMEQCIAMSDADGLRSVAHGLKGAASYVEAGTVRSLAERLEAMGRATDLSETAACFRELQASLKNCLAYGAGDPAVDTATRATS